MKIGVAGTKASILGGNKCVIPRILVEPAGDIVEFLEEVGIQDVHFIWSDPDYGACKDCE